MANFGILGGTFSPPHLGHLDIAEIAKKLFELDIIYLMPCQFPPHKQQCIETYHRLNMLRILFRKHHYIQFDFSEILRDGPSLTYLSMQAWRKKHPDDRLFFILGSDSFLSITSWDFWQDIILNCELIVIPRGMSADDIHIPDQWQNKADKIHIIRESVRPISSTDVRNAGNTNEIISLLGDDTAAYYIDNCI